MDKIISSEKEVISSGVFLSFDKGPSKLTFEYNKKEYTIEFVFDDNNEKKQQINFANIGEDILQMTFVNFKNVLGTGNAEPLHIGTIDNRKLYCNVDIMEVGDVRKRVFYAFYLGETSNAAE